MKSRRVLATSVALLVVLGAMGAIAVQALSESPARPIVMPSTESGALSHFALADQQAAAWRDDAVLVRVGATEGTLVDGRIDPPFLWDTSSDTTVGNGRALVWTFAYASPDLWDRSFWVSIGGDGSVLYARELQDPFTCCVEYVTHDEMPAHSGSSESTSIAPPLPNRELTPVNASIDAPAAYAAVLDHPAFRNFSLDHPVYQANVELAPGPEGGSVWLLGFRTATYYGAGAVVDAQTGDVLHVGSWPHRCCEPLPPRPPQPPEPPTPPEPCCRPADHRAEYSGQLDDWGSFDVSFPVENAFWLAEMTVVAQLTDPLPHERYILTLHDGHGRIIAKSEGRGLLEMTLNSATVSGTYTAYIHTVSDVGYSMPVPMDRPSALVAVNVLYAETPLPRATLHTFYGEAWSGDHWLDLYVEGEWWNAMTPQTVTLSWTPRDPTQSLQLVLVDQWGNEIMTSGESTVTPGSTQVVSLSVPEDVPGVGVIVRAPQMMISTTPYALDVEYAPWAPPEMELHEAHEGHRH